MAITDGTVHGVHDVRITGCKTQQWNLALLSDGYRQGDELATFAVDADEFATKLLEVPPFVDLVNEINIYRIDVSSVESGADDADAGTFRRTYFDAAFSTDPGLTRVLDINIATAQDVLQNHAPWADAGLVIVNTKGFGGSGKEVAAVVRGKSGHRVALHELGHTAFGLEDEYPYLKGCDSGEDRAQHPGPEPAGGNVTLATAAGQIPWKALLTDPHAPLPTTANPNCAECDLQDYSLLGDVVGAFEGAGKYHCGAYRPQFDCAMRDYNRDFCDVCVDKITAVIKSARWP